MLGFRAELGAYYEAARAAGGGAAPQTLANWICNELVARLGPDTDPSESRVTAPALAALVGMVDRRELNQGGARQVLDALIAEGGDPAAIVEREGLAAVGGTDELAPVVAAALDANPEVAGKLRGGDMKPIGVIVGFVMRETKGRADGGEVTRLVRDQLGL